MRGSARLHQGLRTPKSHRNPWAAAFKAPLALLDFEAVQPPVPRWPGCGPYTHIPVQLSCHTLAAACSGSVGLLPVLSGSVYDPAFGGNVSLKSVVPVLAPKARYRGMAVSEGRTATNELMRLLQGGHLGHGAAV